jgi:hypothetical protein
MAVLMRGVKNDEVTDRIDVMPELIPTHLLVPYYEVASRW